MIKKLLAAALIATSLVAPANAAIRITFDGGGSLIEFIDKYSQWKQAEAKVIVDGVCASACTLMLGILKRSNVCSTDNGYMAFHSASYKGEHSVEGTRLMWRYYPRDVRAALTAKGWNAKDGEAHPDLIYIRATQFYQECPNYGDFSGRTVHDTKPLSKD